MSNIICPKRISLRVECKDDLIFDVLIFEEGGIWVSHILDADQVTQGGDIGDAVNMAIDAMECIPPEHRMRPAPDEECSNHAIRRLEKVIDQLREELNYFRNRASPSFVDIEESGIAKSQAVLWLRRNGAQEVQDGWNVNFMVRLGGMISGKNEFDIMREMLDTDADDADEAL